MSIVAGPGRHLLHASSGNQRWRPLPHLGCLHRLPSKKTAGADIYCGTSVDQLIAQKYGQDTLLPSIQLAIEDPGANTGICGWGYSCAYSNSISWASPTKPLPHEINPQIVFEHLYGDGSTPAERQARKAASGSILDSVSRKISRLQKMLPASDQARLTDYPRRGPRTGAPLGDRRQGHL